VQVKIYKLLVEWVIWILMELMSLVTVMEYLMVHEGGVVTVIAEAATNCMVPVLCSSESA
jgi:hypothetical protein